MSNAYTDRASYLHRTWLWTVNLDGVWAARRPVWSPSWGTFVCFLILSLYPLVWESEDWMSWWLYWYFLNLKSSSVNHLVWTIWLWRSNYVWYPWSWFWHRVFFNNVILYSSSMTLLTFCCRLCGRDIFGSTTDSMMLVPMWGLI